MNGYTVLLTAMKEEQQWLLNRSHNVERLKNLPGGYTARMNGVPVLLARCGVGKVNAALGCARLLSWQACRLIMVGSAASLQPDLRVGHFVLADQLAYHDVDLTSFGYSPGQLPACPQFFRADQQLTQQAAKLLAERNHPWREGLIVSGDQFVEHGGEHLRRIQRLFPQALAVEMESAAVAHACQQLNWPFLALRVISDTLDGDEGNARQFADFLAGPHGSRLGEFVFQFVSQIGSP